jgi:hypothetical protein
MKPPTKSVSPFEKKKHTDSGTIQTGMCKSSEKERYLYKNFSVSLDGNIMANSQHPVDPYNSMICSFFKDYV